MSLACFCSARSCAGAETVTRSEKRDVQIRCRGFDKPPAAAVEVNMGDATRLWVFACSTTNRLEMNIRNPGDNWQGWTFLAASCADVPTAGKWRRDTVGADHVLVYYRDTSNQLKEVWFPDASDPSNRFVSNISSASGIGPISGAPQIAEAELATTHHVVVSTDSQNVYTRLVQRLLARHKGCSNRVHDAIKSTRPFRTLPGWRPCEICSRIPTQISGRGLTTSDTSTGWVAMRQSGPPVGSNPVNASRNSSFDVPSASGSPVTYGPASDGKYRVAATFSDDVLKSATISTAAGPPCLLRRRRLAPWRTNRVWLRARRHDNCTAGSATRDRMHGPRRRLSSAPARCVMPTPSKLRFLSGQQRQSLVLEQLDADQPELPAALTGAGLVAVGCWPADASSNH